MSAHPGYDPQHGADRADAAAPDQQSTASLLKQLAHEVPALLGKEVALFKAEARESLHSTRIGVAAVASGGAVMLAGLVVVLMAAVYGLSEVIAPWLAALIVGIAAMVVGRLMAKAGEKKFDTEALRPDRTIDSVRKDKDTLRGSTP